MAASVMMVKVVPAVGGESIRIIAAIRAGFLSASAVATSPPMEWPITVTRSMPSRSSTAATSSACRGIV